jgi:hypothetical protein
LNQTEDDGFLDYDAVLSMPYEKNAHALRNISYRFTF